MSASALFLGFLGVIALFLPQEILNYFSISVSGIAPLIIQLLGALYSGFALLNWMTKDNKIGGIYARPLIMGNLTHFMIAALTLIKASFSGVFTPILLLFTIVYSIFALLFGLLGFTDWIKLPDK